jgi:hypothetical protein
MRVLIVEDEPYPIEEVSTWRDERAARCRGAAHSPARSIATLRDVVNAAWQHHAALSGGMSYSPPASVNLYLVSLLPFAVISIGWRSLRIAGPRAARA